MAKTITTTRHDARHMAHEMQSCVILADRLVLGGGDPETDDILVYVYPEGTHHKSGIEVQLHRERFDGPCVDITSASCHCSQEDATIRAAMFLVAVEIADGLNRENGKISDIGHLRDVLEDCENDDDEGVTWVRTINRDEHEALRRIAGMKHA